MRVLIRGHHLPGASWCEHSDIHVGVQVRRDPWQLVPGDSATAEWELDIEVCDGDFRGPAVQGRKGERFVYLTWGSLTGGTFAMFRRAKLMLDDLPGTADLVVASVHLTDDRGGPRCARLKPPALELS